MTTDIVMIVTTSQYDNQLIKRGSRNFTSPKSEFFPTFVTVVWAPNSREMLSSVNNTTEMLSSVNKIGNIGNNYGECQRIHEGELPDVYRKSFSLIYWANVPVTVTTNIFLIIALWRTNQLRNTAIKLIIAIKCSHTFGGILVFH